MLDEEQRAHLKWLEAAAKETRLKYEQEKQKLDKLTEEVNRLGADSRRLAEAVETIRRSLGLSVPVQPALEATRFRDMSIVQAAEVAMREAGGQMSVTDLVKVIKKGGKELRTGRWYGVVTATLLRSKRFERVQPGVYRLREEK